MNRGSKKLAPIILKSSVNRLILRWYARVGRDLPWRNETNPYRVLISEVMLQQTQVGRVLEKYPLFLKRFPSMNALARARRSSVIMAWKGMGYNNRAVRLHRLAKTVISEHSGRFPNTEAELELFPGIGKYTAHAIACFAFNRQVPVVDTNVRRVLTRIFPKQAKRADEWDLAAAMLPNRRAFDWNQALMDLGSTLCTARNPQCADCPVRKVCPSAFKVQMSPVARTSTEPSRDGLPNRIYRGRIVEALRTHPAGKPMAISQLGHHIKSAYSPRDEQWLKHIVAGLEKDGLVAVKMAKKELRVSLPR